jgi:hypothetical protein
MNPSLSDAVARARLTAQCLAALDVAERMTATGLV